MIRSTASFTKFAAVALVATAVALGGLLTAPAVDAAPSGICDYYSDASMTELVGRHGYDCCGKRVDWGLYTDFRDCYQEVCVWCPPES